jgi:hypothetical protein
MNAPSIFAGLDATGAIRFVGDVPRGAACHCRCAACNAPLVAKRGNINTWHFAHEASQERPECFAGAVNLLRRLAIEHLQELGNPPLPRRRILVVTAPPLPVHQEHVEWEVGTGRMLQWHQQPIRNAPVGTLQLATGTKVQMFAEVAGGRGVNLDQVASDEGSLLFNVPLPDEAGQLKSLESAKHHIGFTGRFHWLQLPDNHPKVAEARERLVQLAQRRQEHAGAAKARRFGPWYGPTGADLEVAPKVPPVPPAPERDGSPWASWRKPHSAFIFYGLKDGSAWVWMTHKDGRPAIAPWPSPFDGWEKVVPPKHGTPDVDLGVFFVADRVYMASRLALFSRAMSTHSKWQDLQAVRWPLPPT